VKSSSDNHTTGDELVYVTLREEILTRIEVRHQLIAANLAIVGIILGLGIGTRAVAFLYPPLAVVLATGWVHNELRIRQISKYIGDKIEPLLQGLGWEKFRQSTDHETRIGAWPLNLLSAGGVFLGTQVVAICLGVFNFTSSTVEWFLFAIDVLSVILLAILLWDFRRRRKLYVGPLLLATTHVFESGLPSGESQTRSI